MWGCDQIGSFMRGGEREQVKCYGTKKRLDGALGLGRLVYLSFTEGKFFKVE